MERSAGSGGRQDKQGTQRPWVFPVVTSALRRADIGHWRGQEQECERDFLWLMEQSFRLHKPSVVHKEEQSSRVVMSLIDAAGAKELYSDAWAISTERTEPHGVSCHAAREETSLSDRAIEKAGAGISPPSSTAAKSRQGLMEAQKHDCSHLSWVQPTRF